MHTIVTLMIILCSYSESAHDLFANNQSKDKSILETELSSAKSNIEHMYDLDTIKLDFLPVFNGNIRSYRTVLKNKPIDVYPVYSEILLLERNSNDIIASYIYCKDGLAYLTIYDNDYGLSTLPCNQREWVPGVNFKCHKRIEKWIRKGHSGIYLMDDEELLYYGSIEDESPVNVCQ